MAKFEKGTSGNKLGRPEGSTNKVPSNEAMITSFKEANPAAIKKLVSLVATGAPGYALKAATIIIETNIKIIANEEKLKLSSPSSTPSEEAPKAKVLKLAGSSN